MKKIFSANSVFWFVYLFLRGKSSRWSEPHEIDIQTKKLPWSESHEIDIKLKKLPWYETLGFSPSFSVCYFSRNLLPTLKVGKNVL